MNVVRMFAGSLFLTGLFAVSGFADDPKIKPASKDVPRTIAYEPTKIRQVHLQISAEEYAAMQPRGGGGGFRFGKPPEKPPEKKDDKREVHRNTFGVDLPWATGTIALGDETFENIGLRFKGNGTIADAQKTIRKSFKIDLDRLGGTGTFLGAKGINLHSGIADPTRIRETIGYSIYRAAGVPAPRTTLAEVRLTVPGKFDRELLGVYTLVEPADKTFLRDFFKDDAGLLMKPEAVGFGGGAREFAYKGEDWATYEKIFAPKRPATPEQGKRMVALIRLVDKGDDAEFEKQIGDYLEIDNYLRFLATTSFQANMASFFSIGHNFYLYLHSKTGKLHFFPWDLDRSFANLPFFGSTAQQMDLSLVHPYPGTHRLTERLLAIPAVSDKYQALLKDLSTTAFDQARLVKEIDAMEVAVKDLVAAETKAAAARKETLPGGNFFAIKAPTLKVFVEKRTASIAAQLAGTSKGFTPTSFGFGPPKVGDIMAARLLPELDTDKDGKLSRKEWLAITEKVFTAADKTAQGWIDEKSLIDGLTTLLPKPPAPGPGGPPPFNNAAFLAPPIIKRADADKNGKVTHAELITAAEKAFDDFDKTKSGSLTQSAFSDMLTVIFPAPAFGPAPRPGPMPENPNVKKER